MTTISTEGGTRSVQASGGGGGNSPSAGNTLNSRHIQAEEVEVICKLHLALSL